MVYALGLLLLVAGFLLLVFGWRLYGQPKVGEQISVWRGLVPILDEPPQRFYTRLYQALNASLQSRLAAGHTAPNCDASSQSGSSPVEVTLTGMGFGPHRLFAAPSLLADRPLYLLVRYRHLRCYIYAGQTPTGLFISSWGYSDFQLGESRLLAPHKRAWRYFTRQTLFQYDAALIFTHCVQEILCDTVNGYLQERDLEPLEGLERRPILHAFYQNPFYGNAASTGPSQSYGNGVGQQSLSANGLTEAGERFAMGGRGKSTPAALDAVAVAAASKPSVPVTGSVFVPPPPQSLFAMDESFPMEQSFPMDEPFPVGASSSDEPSSGELDSDDLYVDEPSTDDLIPDAEQASTLPQGGRV